MGGRERIAHARACTHKHSCIATHTCARTPAHTNVSRIRRDGASAHQSGGVQNRRVHPRTARAARRPPIRAISRRARPFRRNHAQARIQLATPTLWRTQWHARNATQQRARTQGRLDHAHGCAAAAAQGGRTRGPRARLRRNNRRTQHGSRNISCCRLNPAIVGDNYNVYERRLFSGHVCRRAALPHRRRDLAHPTPHLRRDWAPPPSHIYAGACVGAGTPGSSG